MTMIDDVRNLRQQGLSDSEISQRMREQGFSPKDIRDSLAQADIKNAIYQPEGEYSEYEAEELPQPQQMQQSMMPVRQQSTQSQQTGEQEFYPPEPAPTESTEEYIYPTPQPYQEYQPYQYQEVSTDTIAEIADQLVSERIEDIKTRIDQLLASKARVDNKIENIDIRLKKIEDTIDKLQADILRKVAGYGTSISDLSKEMRGVRESFTKILPKRKSRKKKK